MRDEIPAAARRLLATWERSWGTTDLASALRVVPNPRLTVTAGRCAPSKRVIELRPDVFASRSRVFAQVLCHEAAHLAVHQMYGRNEPPHGDHWSALVEAAGFEPKIGARRSCFVRRQRLSPKRRRNYEHRCPVCQSIRLARQPMRRWRCSSCVQAGLSGELRISRRAIS